MKLQFPQQPGPGAVIPWCWWFEPHRNRDVSSSFDNSATRTRSQTIVEKPLLRPASKTAFCRLIPLLFKKENVAGPVLIDAHVGIVEQRRNSDIQTL